MCIRDRGDPMSGNDGSGLDPYDCYGDDGNNGGIFDLCSQIALIQSGNNNFTGGDVSGFECTDANGNTVDCSTPGAVLTAIVGNQAGGTPSVNVFDWWVSDVAIALGLFWPPGLEKFPGTPPLQLPTICGGGAFFFAGGKLPFIFSAYGLPIIYDSKEGFSVGGIGEAHIPFTSLAVGVEVSYGGSPPKVHGGLIGLAEPGHSRPGPSGLPVGVIADENNIGVTVGGNVGVGAYAKLCN